MHFQSYFNTATALLQQYNGETPLSHFLKNYFSQHKKHGSKDRKYITHVCYNFYRLGNSLKDLPLTERLAVALFVGNDRPQEWGFLFTDNWLTHWSTDLTERIDFIKTIYPAFAIDDIFVWKDEISAPIDFAAFALSHAIQPDLFLRIRPGRANIVKQKLAGNNILFREISSSCLSLLNATKVEGVLQLDEEAVVQDYSSQRIASFLTVIQSAIGNDKRGLTVWDCCAASGGKSILAKDVFGKVNLTVSDVRPSILHNLEKRFAKAGINSYHSFIADISKPEFKTPLPVFDVVIADVPCSGSGTWSRTPEQLYFFKKEKINEYAQLQQKIVAQAVGHVKPSGYFLYITCSVFKKENEENVAFMQQQCGLQLIQQEILTGYKMQADTMFAALLKKTPASSE